jgi:hypothetical protein
MKIELKSLFPTPLIRFKFTKHYLYHFDEIPKSVNKPDGWIKPLNTSFGIDDGDNFLSTDTKNKLISNIKNDIDEVFSKLEIPTCYDIPKNQFWYNIYHDNQGQEIHDHISGPEGKNPYWCGIYYNKGNIPTSFIRPYTLHRINRHPEYMDTKSPLFKFYNDMESPTIEPGDIIMFPPWMEHYVDVGDICKDNMRLTFSFNLEYTGDY